jgi:hypothetical protein
MFLVVAPDCSFPTDNLLTGFLGVGFLISSWQLIDRISIRITSILFLSIVTDGSTEVFSSEKEKLSD